VQYGATFSTPAFSNPAFLTLPRFSLLRFQCSDAMTTVTKARDGYVKFYLKWHMKKIGVYFGF